MTMLALLCHVQFALMLVSSICRILPDTAAAGEVKALGKKPMAHLCIAYCEDHLCNVQELPVAARDDHFHTTSTLTWHQDALCVLFIVNVAHGKWRWGEPGTIAAFRVPVPHFQMQLDGRRYLEG